MRHFVQAKITGIRIKDARTQGLEFLNGMTLQVRGNAYKGFYVVLPNGEWKDVDLFLHKKIYEGQ